MNQQFADLRLDLEILKIQRNLLRLQLLEKVGKSSSASRQEGEEKTEGDNSSVIVYDVEDFSEDPYYEIISKPGNKLKVWLFNQWLKLNICLAMDVETGWSLCSLYSL